MHIEHIDVHLLHFFLLQRHDSSSEIIDFSLLVVLALERRDSSFEIFNFCLLVSVFRLKVPDCSSLSFELGLQRFEAIRLIIELRLLCLILLIQRGDPRP